MQTQDPSTAQPEERGDETVALRAEVDALRHAHADAEQRAAAYLTELDRLQAGVGWRALVAYRRLARTLAPAGTRRADAYDRLTRTARRRAAHLAPPAPAADKVEAPTAPAPVDTAGPPGDDTWFREHYDSAATKVVDFLALDGVTLAGKQVADIGAGDGILDLGLAHKGQPARLVGYDVNPTSDNLHVLLESARAHGVCDDLPDCLEFEQCGPTSIPAEDASFDVVVSWSAFEHIAEPLGVLREARRVIRDDGTLFVQVWPFYHSQFGSHLRDWFPDGWEQLERSPDEIEVLVRASDLHERSWADVMLREFRDLNKITVDDLGLALVDAGFRVVRLNLLTRNVTLPAEAASRLPLSVLGIEGVELTAVPVAATGGDQDAGRTAPNS